MVLRIASILASAGVFRLWATHGAYNILIFGSGSIASCCIRYSTFMNNLICTIALRIIIGSHHCDFTAAQVVGVCASIVLFPDWESVVLVVNTPRLPNIECGSFEWFF